MPRTQPRRRSPEEKAGRVVTNLIKFGGLVLVFNEVLIRPDIRPGTLAVCAFMMAGANGIETVLDRLLGK